MLKLIVIAIAAVLLLAHLTFRALGRLLAASGSTGSPSLAGPRTAYAARWSSAPKD